MTIAEVAEVAEGFRETPPLVGGPCTNFTYPGQPEALQLVAVDGRLRKVVLTGYGEGAGAVTTDRGIAIGASTAELESAYGADLERVHRETETGSGAPSGSGADVYLVYPASGEPGLGFVIPFGEGTARSDEVAEIEWSLREELYALTGTELCA